MGAHSKHVKKTTNPDAGEALYRGSLGGSAAQSAVGNHGVVIQSGTVTMANGVSPTIPATKVVKSWRFDRKILPQWIHQRN